MTYTKTSFVLFLSAFGIKSFNSNNVFVSTLFWYSIITFVSSFHNILNGWKSLNIVPNFSNSGKSSVPSSMSFAFSGWRIFISFLIWFWCSFALLTASLKSCIINETFFPSCSSLKSSTLFKYSNVLSNSLISVLKLNWLSFNSSMNSAFFNSKFSLLNLATSWIWEGIIQLCSNILNNSSTLWIFSNFCLSIWVKILSTFFNSSFFILTNSGIVANKSNKFLYWSISNVSSCNFCIFSLFWRSNSLVLSKQ